MQQIADEFRVPINRVNALFEIPRVALQENRVLVPVYILVRRLQCRLQFGIELALRVQDKAVRETWPLKIVN